MCVHYSPYDHDVYMDPYPVYAALRDQAPIYRNDELGFWALARHSDVTAALRDHTLFAAGPPPGPLLPGPLPPGPRPPGNAQLFGRCDVHRTAGLASMDPERHAQLRVVISRAFTPRRAARLEPLINDLARSYLEPAVGGGSFDFIADVAEPLALDVLSGLIGVPGCDRDEVRRLALAALGDRDDPDAGRAAPAGPAAELTQYHRDILAARSREPSQDLASSLLGADAGGERLTEDEIVGVLLALLAGARALAMLLGNAWYWAWRNPVQGAVPFQDPDRVADWAEETLRYDGPSQFVARTLTRDTRMHDEVVPAGGTMLLVTGSANRDHRVFPDPDRIDLDRDTSEVIAFGAGRHLCLGAPLTRLVARLVLTGLARRVRDYEIGTEGIDRARWVNVRGFDRLPTTVTPRTGRAATA